MALVRKQMSAKRKTFFIMAFILAASGLLYYLFPASDSTVSLGDNPATAKLRTELRTVHELDQSLSADVEQLLVDVRFQELTQFGDLPVVVGNIGKANPFKP